MTLQQLNYFVTSCRYNNISRAAEEFSISQPSISAAIKNLEREFGLSLIKRRQTGFVLTPDGEMLCKLAESLLAHADSVSAVMGARGRDCHLVRLGMPPMASAILFPAIYASFRAKCPDIELFTQEAGREDLLKLFEDNLLDMAFLPHTDDLPSCFRVIPLTRFETVCCMPKEHPLASHSCITPADLEGEPLVLFARGFYQTGRVLKMFSQEGIKPQVMHTSTQLSTVEELIAGKVALGFLFREIAAKYDHLAALPLDPPLYTKISLVLKKDCYMNEGMTRFVDLIQTLYHD